MKSLAFNRFLDTRSLSPLRRRAPWGLKLIPESTLYSFVRKKFMNEVYFRNLGMEGKETQLVDGRHNHEK
jgi:hypothetical protein